jgi:hypothetical protein
MTPRATRDTSRERSVRTGDLEAGCSSVRMWCGTFRE